MRNIMREIKNEFMKYDEGERVIREATANDDIPPSSQILFELVTMSSNSQEFPSLFRMLFKRLTDYQYIRHVEKGLIVTEFLLKNGDLRFYRNCKNQLEEFRKLGKYRYMLDGQDIGHNVRQRGKRVEALLTNDKLFEEEREKALEKNKKFLGDNADNFQTAPTSQPKSEEDEMPEFDQADEAEEEVEEEEEPKQENEQEVQNPQQEQEEEDQSQKPQILLSDDKPFVLPQDYPKDFKKPKEPKQKKSKKTPNVNKPQSGNDDLLKDFDSINITEKPAEASQPEDGGQFGFGHENDFKGDKDPFGDMFNDKSGDDGMKLTNVEPQSTKNQGKNLAELAEISFDSAFLESMNMDTNATPQTNTSTQPNPSTNEKKDVKDDPFADLLRF